MVYFIADLHLGHKHAIELNERPFASVHEMDEELIERWNRKVHNGDTVYILGDFIWQKCDPVPYLERLKGKKHLLRGNHDKWLDKYDVSRYFESVSLYEECSINEHPVTLCHYPMLEWKNSRKVGSSRLGYLVHGHIHNTIKPLYKTLFELPSALNAGADINDFTPVTFEELVANNERFKRRALSVLAESVEIDSRDALGEMEEKTGGKEE